MRYIRDDSDCDQIIAIFAYLGYPPEPYMKLLTQPALIDLIRIQVSNLLDQRSIDLPAAAPGQSDYHAMVARLQYHLPKASHIAVEFLANIFVYNYDDRLSVLDLLEHPYFQELPDRAPVRTTSHADTSYEDNHSLCVWRQLTFNEVVDYVAHK